jgi:hypothetical protein
MQLGFSVQLLDDDVKVEMLEGVECAEENHQPPIPSLGFRCRHK